MDTVANNTAVSLDQRIQDAIAEAHTASDKYGPESKESAVAWDTVEELHAEAGHQRTAHEDHNSLTDYCDENPEAPEARVYDV